VPFIRSKAVAEALLDRIVRITSKFDAFRGEKIAMRDE
jgi:hypothetical protein